MSWWDTGYADDVIGDEPADLVRAALREYAALADQSARRRPTVGVLLAAMAMALGSRPAELLSSPTDRTVDALVATTDSGVLRPAERGTVDPALVERLRAAYREIAAVYEDRWERKPRLSELLESAAFVLGHAPERFLAEADGIQIEGIEPG
jgi:hypothetical protein